MTCGRDAIKAGLRLFLDHLSGRPLGEPYGWPLFACEGSPLAVLQAALREFSYDPFFCLT